MSINWDFAKHLQNLLGLTNVDNWRIDTRGDRKAGAWNPSEAQQAVLARSCRLFSFPPCGFPPLRQIGLAAISVTLIYSWPIAMKKKREQRQNSLKKHSGDKQGNLQNHKKKNQEKNLWSWKAHNLSPIFGSFRLFRNYFGPVNKK